MIIAIVGPTGVGKTRMSISLAKKYSAEIISVDSMQIYKKMDIGTAKVTKEEMDGVVHHMIDIKNPEEDYRDQLKNTYNIPLFDTIIKNLNAVSQNTGVSEYPSLTEEFLKRISEVDKEV